MWTVGKVCDCERLRSWNVDWQALEALCWSAGNGCGVCDAGGILRGDDRVASVMLGPLLTIVSRFVVSQVAGDSGPGLVLLCKVNLVLGTERNNADLLSIQDL